MIALRSRVPEFISVTVTPDETPMTRFARGLVKVLVVATAAGLGFGAGWSVGGVPSPGGDAGSTAARARAREMVEFLAEYGNRTGSCTQGLTMFALDGDFGRRRTDPWGRRWNVRCHGDLGVVQSAGPDGDFDTADDVTAVARTRPRR